MMRSGFAPWCLQPETLREVLPPDEIRALTAISEIFDPTKSSEFWESVVARLLDGKRTGHQCEWDVEVAGIKIEVKFSTGYDIRFEAGPRRSFKFASLLGTAQRGKRCDVLVLVGYDEPYAYCWVLPYRLVRSHSMTLMHPAHRATKQGDSKNAKLDRFGSCLSQLLPDVLRAYRENRATPHSFPQDTGQDDLFGAA